MSVAPNLLWFRQDLRLTDNPALAEAMRTGAAVIPVFIWSPEEEGDWPPGGASKWWLHQSLGALQARLPGAGSRLVIRCGPAFPVLRQLVKETGATSVFWNRRYQPAIVQRDTKLTGELHNAGVAARSFNAALLHEPWTIQNQSGKPYQVFTPFWNQCLGQPEPPEPLPAPEMIPGPKVWPPSLAISELELEPRPDWAGGLRAAWQPGEIGAGQKLKRFIADAFDGYSERRNRPDLVGTSRLSPHLHFGEISPRQIWHAVRRRAPVSDPPRSGEARSTSRAGGRRSDATDWRRSQFLTELGWREFAHHLLHHFPQTPTEPLRAEFKSFPWRRDAERLRAWQQGVTGFPIVDAGMRELWATGWMHNRVRMIVASFLVKDLLLPWQEGANWFWDTLVDADLAQNTLGWQWTAGCGADAAPYFRVFNPQLQGQTFDPNGDYVRRWCPELAGLAAKHIHAPDRAPAEVLARAGVTLGRNYPEPMVSHTIAREVALEAYQKIRPALT
jgi:deoxyribodipyrimidine photo-lyase